VVDGARAEIRRVLSGADDRLLVLVGPCSIQDEQAAIEYAARLRRITESLSDDLLIVMRTYFEKPRTSLGWPGLALYPDPHGPADPERGFQVARSLLAEITGMGVAVGTEWLTVAAPAYLDDLVAWGCIGARTVEGPPHRHLASALPMPVGMKNRTDGAVAPAVDAVRIATHGQTYLGVSPDGTLGVARTPGNPDCHVVLRGGSNGPNYHPYAVRAARRLLRDAGLPERLVIDASHDNCAKDHERQRLVAGDIARQVAAGCAEIRGVMLESFLLGGRQDVVAGQPLAFGQSITDECMSWPVTIEVLTELATAAGSRRRRARAGAVVPRPRAEPVPVGRTPAASAVALVEDGMFDSYMVYERNGGWTVAGGVEAVITLDTTHIRLRHDGRERAWAWDSRPLGRLGDVLAELLIPGWTAYGWIAFEVAHLIAGRSELAGDGELAHLIVPKAEVQLDASGARINCADEALHARIQAVLADQAAPLAPATATVDIHQGRDWYRQAVADAVDEIRRHAFEKVVLSRQVFLDGEVDLAQTYLLGRAANTPARSFLLDIGGVHATGFCPETVLEATADRIVSTQPLAGTRALGTGQDSDLLLRAELFSDPKEVYEHATAVKLAYDELTRVCEPESVVVSDLMSVARRGSVQHLASRVRGTLGPTRTAWDALEAVFPGVTVSGIPKDAACDYIVRTETSPRGLYSGAVVHAAHDGTLDAGLVLRSVFQQDGQSWLRAGAGIVTRSTPEREYEETCEKLRSIAPYVVTASRAEHAPAAQRETQGVAE
jgi:salicylate synthetase